MADRARTRAALLEAGLRPRLTTLQLLGRTARRQPLGTFGAIVAVAVVLVAIFAPWIETHDPLKIIKTATLAAPNTTYFFGTDNLGRDVFSRVVEGARISVIVGFTAPLLIQVFAALIGIPSAYFGGKYDLIVQRFVDAWNSFPTLILALALVSVLGPSLFNVILAIAITRASGVSRVIRSQALRVREADFVLAAKAIGAGNIRIMFHHILPQVVAVMLVLVSVEIPGAIIAEASLSFLGLGVPPPAPSWGGILSGVGRSYILSAPWIALAPGIAISLVVFGFNMLGDALRDMFDPRLRGQRG